MQSILDAHVDFELKINNKPIDLIKTIWNMMHKTVQYQYHLVSMTDALNQHTKVEQFETESLLGYVSRLKNSNVIKIHLRNVVLDYFIGNSESYINGKTP